MENYHLRKKDFIPVIGYVEYVSRNWNSLKFGGNEKNQGRAISSAVGLCLYNFTAIPLALGLVISGLETVLK